jgi:hypothetical protein
LGWFTSILEGLVIFLAAALAFLAVRRWLPGRVEFDFEPELSIARKDGWALLDLILVNRSKTPVWAEQATFALADLDADFQGAAPSTQEILRIRQTVNPGETLQVSLIETIYTAAGKPQGEYSFLISGMVRYRAGNNWFEISLQTYRVRMIALSAIRLLRMRWYDQPNSRSGAQSRLRKISGQEQEQAQSKEQRL